METKYTNDGKKVVIVGKLNSQETIVQEVFIVNGNEVPSGENFVVKSLHDAPAESWAQTQIKITDKKLQELKSLLDREQKLVDDTIKELRFKGEILREHMKYIGQVTKLCEEKSFQNLVDFLAGDIKYLVDETNGEILSFDQSCVDINYNSWGNRFEGLKLLSLMGKDDGSFSFKVNQYSDGSGYNKYTVSFHKTIESAKERFIEIVNKKSDIGYDTIERASKYGVELPADKVEAYNERCRSSIRKDIESYQKAIEEKTKKLLEI